MHDGDGAERREYRWTPPVGKVRSEYQLFDVDPPGAGFELDERPAATNRSLQAMF